MKKIAFTLLILFILAIAGAIYIYQGSVGELHSNQDKAIERAKKETELADVTNIDWFHYEKKYTVIQGKNRQGENIIVWVPGEKKKESIVVKASEGITEEAAMNLLYNGFENFAADKRPKKIIGSKIGMVDDFPVYEITYRDQKDRYSIIYIDFYKGNWFRVYNL